ncbi:sas-6 [Acrasis kona]|uniref:Sas-6 n=1 Tax=Acrasis kona TaxID=1008807 RepID=A0AAW2Z6X2_9EUKA
MSKRLMDWTTPLPFPQFPNRKDYLVCLESCRAEVDRLKCPLNLLNLLFDTALKFYDNLLQEAVKTRIVFFIAETREELSGELNETKELTFTDEQKSDLLTMFDETTEGVTYTYNTQNHVIKVKRDYIIDFDTL